MNLSAFHSTYISYPSIQNSSHRPLLKCSNLRQTPARDRIIDFGKHKGRMLGTLPSTYLKWISKNLRARDYEDWANLADQVLQDPVYQDRIQWEFAQNILNGNTNRSTTFPSRNGSAVSELLEISERFGWDNNDKVGWSKVDFELLGTSNGGRIPRVDSRSRGDGEERELKERERIGEAVDGFSDGRDRRMERRERMRVKREGKRRTSDKVFGNEVIVDNGVGIDCDGEKVLNQNPKFPGREGLLKKVLNRRRSI